MQISLYEVLIKGIPEGILIAFALYIFTHTPFKKKEFCIISTLFIGSTYFVRILPLNLGFHTIINLFLLTMICNIILNIDVVVAVRALIKVILIILISEALNMLLLNIMVQDNLQILLLTGPKKAFYTIPSTIIFGTITYALWRRSQKKNVKENL